MIPSTLTRGQRSCGFPVRHETMPQEQRYSHIVCQHHVNSRTCFRAAVVRECSTKRKLRASGLIVPLPISNTCWKSLGSNCRSRLLQIIENNILPAALGGTGVGYVSADQVFLGPVLLTMCHRANSARMACATRGGSSSILIASDFGASAGNTARSFSSCAISSASFHGNGIRTLAQ